MNDALAGKTRLPFFPKVIESPADLGEIEEVASQMAVKVAATTANFGTQWMVQQLRLPHRVVDKILWDLKEEKLVEILKQTGALTYQYRITNGGLELASRLMSLCGYLGPTPVSLADYINSVLQQRRTKTGVTLENVEQATADLTLDTKIREVATLAYASNRSLFIFGPPGNGKSTLGRKLHSAKQNYIWIPHAIAVDGQVIRMFDPQYHHPVDTDHPEGHDERWVRIELPFVISGCELTMTELDLVFDRSSNYYEAPPHLKANCGTYFIDDLGRQRVPTADLLNRWIIPLEQKIDFLSLVNGKKIEVPFEMMLVVATNLKVSDVADAAFLRRMGYRIHLDNPTEADFRTIFENQARRTEIELAPDLLDQVVSRYKSENRQWRASEPRDLIIRCLDVINLRGVDRRIDMLVMDVAWTGYFSDESAED